jgi:hypothetical protein
MRMRIVLVQIAIAARSKHSVHAATDSSDVILIPVATVSRELAECYEKLFVSAKGTDGEKHAKGRTAYKAALSSPSRVALAHSWGLNLVDHHDAFILKFRAGQHADIATLEAARGLGLPFTGEICDGAAASKSVHAMQKLEWLHLVQRCPLPTAGTPPAAATITLADLIAPRDITATAAANGNIVVLRWLKEQERGWGFVGDNSQSCCAAQQPAGAAVPARGGLPLAR